MDNQNPTPSPAPQRLGVTYPPYPFWAWTCSRNPEVAEDKGQWHRLTGPLPRGRSWPFYYWLPDQPEKPTCDPRTVPSPAPEWAIRAAEEIIPLNDQFAPYKMLPMDEWQRRVMPAALCITKHAAALSEENQKLRELYRRDYGNPRQG